MKQYLRDLYLDLRLGALCVALTAGGCLSVLSVRLADRAGHQHYVNFTVGLITRLDIGKSRDYVLFFLTLILTSICVLLALVLMHYIKNTSHSEATAREFDELLLMACLPFALWFVSRIHGGVSTEWLQVHCIFASLTILLAVVSLPHLKESNAAEALDQMSAVLLLGATCQLAALIVLASMTRLRPEWFQVAGLLGHAAATVSWIKLPVWISPAAAFLVMIGLRGPTPTSRLWLRRALLLVQLILSLGFLSLMPGAWMEGDRYIFRYQTSTAFKVTIAVAIFVAWVAILRRPRSIAPTERLWRLMTPMALAGAIVFLRSPPLAVYALPAEDYHFGEILFPWDQLASYGSWPFRDIVPIHGLWELIPGLLGNLFFSDTAVGYALGSTVFQIATLLLAFFLLSRLTNPLFGTLIVCLWPIGLRQFPPFALAVSGMLLMLEPYVRSSSTRLLVTWALVSAIMVPLVLPHGPALAAATAAFVGLSMVSAYRNARALPWKTAVILAAAALVVLLTPIGSIYTGVLRYISNNAGANPTAGGIPWSLVTLNFSDELVRFLWVPALGALLLVMWRRWALPGAAGSASTGWLVLTIGLFALFMSPYSIGRIDGYLRTRPTDMTIVVVCVVLPVIAYADRLARIGILVLLVGGVSGTLFWVIDTTPPPDPRTLLTWARATVQAPPRSEVTDGESIGLPRIGRVIAQTDHVARVLAIQGELERLAPANAPFLDVTNRQALYYYLHRKMPVPLNPYFNLMSVQQEAWVVQELRDHPPAVALAWADTVQIDAITPSLRAYWLYRYLATHYRPILAGERVYLVLPEQAERLASDPLPRYFVACARDAAGWQHGVRTASDQPGFCVRHAVLTIGLGPGSELEFPASGRRVVSAIHGTEVWVKGAPLDPTLDGYPHRILLRRGTKSPELETDLLIQSLGTTDLAMIPNAWGRSWDTLSRHVGAPTALSQRAGKAASVEHAAGKGLDPSGSEAESTDYAPGAPISGKDYGFLKLEFTCEPGSDPTRVAMAVYWAARDAGFDERNRIQLIAKPGTLLIPLDVHPGWLLDRDIGSLRITLQRPGKCRVSTDSVPMLYPRSPSLSQTLVPVGACRMCETADSRTTLARLIMSPSPEAAAYPTPQDPQRRAR